VSRGRVVFAVVILVALVVLVGWQQYREGAMRACLADGRMWNGPLSRCEMPRLGPLLRRSLERT
jgi:hypothetical protein